MGVSGSGKSTIGKRVAKALGIPFLDADSLHPEGNVAKMAAGIPLTDDDRWAWLAAVGEQVAEHPSGLIAACSALKRSYRAAISRHAPDAFFVHLRTSRAVLETRLETRKGHFMPGELLDSQLATLEPLAADEHGVTLDGAQSIDEVVAATLDSLGGGTP